MIYNAFSGIQNYKIWESNNYDYGHPRRHAQQSNKKPKHKYQVNDKVLDVIEGKVGRIRELLTWPNYLVVDSSTPTGLWICNEVHIEPLAEDIDKSESTLSINDYWEEEQEPTLSTLHKPLSTKIIDITDTGDITGDITISKGRVDLANDSGIYVTDTVNKHDRDIDDLRHISDINMQRTTNIECRHNDIEQKVEDLETKQKRISKLSKLALLSRFL